MLSGLHLPPRAVEYHSWQRAINYDDCVLDASQECLQVFTFSQDLRDLGVTGTEGAVDLEAVGIIQK